MALLEIHDLSMHFGGFCALSSIDLQVEQGLIHAIIGPNGAGKTTLFNLVNGVYEPSGGTIKFKGIPLNGMKSHRRTALGIGRTFQNIKLFPHMTVLENVMVGQYCRTTSGVFRSFVKLPFRQLKEEERARAAALELLELTGLIEKRHMLARSLSFGEQKHMEIARALASEPELLLLDEPAAGMNPQETIEMNELIRSVNQMGKTVLLIEHDMNLVMAISQTVTVLNFGEKIATGTPAEVQKNPRVIEAYLGEAA